VEEAKITSGSIKYFGHYPVLCPGLETVYGIVWYAPTIQVVERLRQYESNMYREAAKYVELKDGTERIAKAFIWNGLLSDLEDEPIVGE